MENTKENIESFRQAVKALILLQQELKLIKKESENPYFKSRYSSLATIWNSVIKLLGKHGFAITQSGVVIEGKFYLRTMLLHESGQCISGDYPIIVEKEGPQAYGASFSYAKRYAISGLLFLVSDDEDDDGEGAMSRGETSQKTTHHLAPVSDRKISPAQAGRFAAKAAAAKKTKDEVRSKLRAVIGSETAENIPLSKYDDLCAWADRDEDTVEDVSF